MSTSLQQEYDRLPDTVRWALERADGYMDLKMWSRARSELETIEACHLDSAPCAQAFLRLNMEEKAWQPAADIAHRLCERVPDEPVFWVQHAYATRRCRNLDAASAILEEALRRFPDEAVIRYNLACYACKDGRLAAATDLLHEAIRLDRAFRALACEDRDLEPLWDVFEEEE